MLISDRIIRLGPGECPDLETGARYFAALAFPGAHEGQSRLDATRGWVGAYLHEANRVDGCKDPFEDQRLNAFVQLPQTWCRRQVRTTRRRLGDRNNAARAVRPWMRDLLGHPHAPVPGIKKFTQRQIALYLCDDDPDRSANFQKRVWRSSRPVLHLAIAVDELLCALGQQRTDYGIDLGSTVLFGELIARAKSIQDMILDDPRFGVAAEDLLQMDWVP